MLNSVRVRLTLWYTAALACVLVVLVLTAYFALRKNLQRRTDGNLIQMADSFLSTVRAELSNGESETIREALASAIAEHHFRDTMFLVLNQDGSVLAASEDFSPLREKASGAVAKLSANSSSAEPLHRTLTLSERSYRSYVRRFSAVNGDYQLVVLQSQRQQEELLETLADTFAFIIPLAIVLASAGGYFLARRSLTPVVAMSTQAERIGAENLHERLAVQNAKDELGHLAQSFNRLLDRLDQSFERQRRFVADASHELRTPVAILCGEADVTLSQPDRSPEEYRESLNILRAEARRLKQIVEDLFTLARADAGQHPLTLTDFYLDELVSQCARNMRTLAAAKKLALLCESPTELPVHADEALICRMIQNLLDNAIKYTPEGGTVSITSGIHNSFYSVTISDTGEGIPLELQPRIFERFFRADKVRSRSGSETGGAGLGLSIGRWIVEAHGGRIELTRSDKQGSIFTVYLPPVAALR
jgi:heavy metal sensor kinase